MFLPSFMLVSDTLGAVLFVIFHCSRYVYVGVYDLGVAVLEEANAGLGYCGEHEHVAKVEVTDRTGRFSVGGEMAVELLLGISPWRVILERFSCFDLVLNALDNVLRYHDPL